MATYRRPPRQCLGCRRLIATGQPRCPACAASHEAIRNRRKRQLYGTAAYQTARAALLSNATRCWICGKPPTADDPLTADHVEPLARQHGAPNHLDLRPAHRSCNSRRRNTLIADMGPGVGVGGRRESFGGATETRPLTSAVRETPREGL